MEYKKVELEAFIAKRGINYPQKEALERFSTHLERYKANLKEAYKKQESEENVKNYLSDMLKDMFGYKCNTKDNIDLVIYEDSQAKVIFEVKRENSPEFVCGGGAYIISEFRI